MHRRFRLGLGLLGGVVAGGNAAWFATSAASANPTGNPQLFTGYWRSSSGDLFWLKQWGRRVTGSMEGTVEKGVLVGKTGEKMALSPAGDAAESGAATLKRTNPELIVVCGPSGVGKGTLLHKLFKEYPERFGFSVSHTTRAPREGEKHGVDYFFTSHDEIKKMIDKQQFIEYAEVHGNYYGTSKAAVQAVKDSGKLCVLDIDVQGAQKVKSSGIPFVGIFIKPPSPEELERRLRGRGTETEEKIQRRLKNSLGEIAFCDTHEFFWFELVNNDLEACYEELKTAIGQATQCPYLPQSPFNVNATPRCGVYSM